MPLHLVLYISLFLFFALAVYWAWVYACTPATTTTTRDRFVNVGDGTTPVDQLVLAFNRRRKAQGKYTTDVVHWDYIREQLGVKGTAKAPTQAVPRRGQTVYITHLKNGYNGVDRTSVPLSEVPSQVTDTAARVAKVLGMNLIGIDYMCEDIRRDVPGYIIEVNSVPDYTPHAKQEGPKRAVSRRFVHALFA